MGIKSTVTLTREEAEARLEILMSEFTRENMRHVISVMTNEEIENYLEIINDNASENGEGFNNYMISERRD